MRHHFTKPQLAELREQLKKGPRPAYGAPRVRVQNKLIKLELSRLSEDGRTCEITDKGRFRKVQVRGVERHRAQRDADRVPEGSRDGGLCGTIGY